MHHLFALSRTLRIRQYNGLAFSTASSISPLPTITDYSSARSDFHSVSRAVGPRWQYRMPKVTVGTAKKSIAAIASRWFRRKLSHGVYRSWSTPYPSRHCRFRQIEAQLEQLAMNPWCSPGWVLSNHLKDQGSNFLAHRLSASPRGGP